MLDTCFSRAVTTGYTLLYFLQLCYYCQVTFLLFRIQASGLIGRKKT